LLDQAKSNRNDVTQLIDLLDRVPPVRGLVVLTDQGRTTMDQARRHHRHGIEQYFSCHLADTDIKALTRALEKLSTYARPLRPGRIRS
jgi:hypothetical protein